MICLPFKICATACCIHVHADTHITYTCIFLIHSMIQVKIKCADQSDVGDDTFEILTHVLLRINHLKFGRYELGY